MLVDGVEPLHFHHDEMRILVGASDDVPAFLPVLHVYDAQEWHEDIPYDLVFHDIAVQVEGVHARVEIDGQFGVVRIEVTNRNQLFGAFSHEPQHGSQFRSKFFSLRVARLTAFVISDSGVLMRAKASLNDRQPVGFSYPFLDLIPRDYYFSARCPIENAFGPVMAEMVEEIFGY